MKLEQRLTPSFTEAGARVKTQPVPTGPRGQMSKCLSHTLPARPGRPGTEFFRGSEFRTRGR